MHSDMKYGALCHAGGATFGIHTWIEVKSVGAGACTEYVVWTGPKLPLVDRLGTARAHAPRKAFGYRKIRVKTADFCISSATTLFPSSFQ
jgi:hypothetical protein